MVKPKWMSSLQVKFLLPLLLVAITALSAALILRGFIIGDFRQLFEGGAEDRVQMVINDIEGQYERSLGLRQEDISASVIRALMLGMEVKLFDQADKELVNSQQAIATLSPLMKKRVLANVGDLFSDPAGAFTDYPLFYAGNNIGHIEIRQLVPVDKSTFISKSNRYLLFVTLSLGSLAILLGIIWSRHLTKPLNHLMLATRTIASGDYSNRVPIVGNDEIAQLSDCFNSMASALEAQEKLRKKLLGNAAHELRTPLMVIRGELEGMIDGLLPTGKDNLQSLHDEAGRLTAILDGLDDLTRAEASILSLHRQKIMLAPFLTRLAERFIRMASEQAVLFRLECNDAATVYADPDKLSQIIINLVSNALKATSEGGEIVLRAGNKEETSFLEVADTGKGIPEKDLPYVFERFYRVENSGLGLGLAIVSELVRGHNGTINVASIQGKGSTFTVHLPALPAG